jgi:pseudouridine synthase
VLKRLNKALAEAGVASRRRAEDLIRAGRVKVNGKVVLNPAHKVQDGDELEVDGQRVQRTRRRVALLLYKPPGYVSTVRDPWGRPTVLDLVGPSPYRLFPVGRLDLDSEGLLILTNDGELTQLLTHPRYGIEKTYEVLVRGRPSTEAIKRLEQGIRLEEGLTAPAKVRILRRQGLNTLLEITIHEGRKRQIKRMCQAVGHPVLFLKRTRIAFLTLAGLSPGKYRTLTQEEIGRLKSEARTRLQQLPE